MFSYDHGHAYIGQQIATPPFTGPAHMMSPPLGTLPEVGVVRSRLTGMPLPHHGFCNTSSPLPHLPLSVHTFDHRGCHPWPHPLQQTPPLGLSIIHQEGTTLDRCRKGEFQHCLLYSQMVSTGNQYRSTQNIFLEKDLVSKILVGISKILNESKDNIVTIKIVGEKLENVACLQLPFNTPLYPSADVICHIGIPICSILFH